MKKILLPLLAVTLLMASCLKDEETHFTQILSPSGLGVVFADQYTDTLYYNTTERHSVTTVQGWMEPEADFISDIKFKDNTLYNFRVPIRFDANITGKRRSGEVNINAGDYSAQAFFVQVGFLQITRPLHIVSSSLDLISFGPLGDSIYSEVDSITFTVYDNWTLTAGEWATPAQTSGAAGTHTIRLDYTTNPSATELRRDSVVLTSRGVSEAIPLFQQRHKE